MPSSATITSFYNFTALTVIRSAQVNTNFDTFRGHIIPVDPSTATSAATMTYDLGSIDHFWRGNFNQYGIMYGNTAGSVPTVPTSTAYALYFKSDGNLYKKDSIGNEASFITAAGNLNVASTTGGFTLTNSNDVVLANISASSSTYNLFTAVGNSGKEITIKKIDSTLNVVTIDANSTETIDGSLTTTLNTQYESIKLVSDGTNWHILERKIPREWASYTPSVSTGVMGSGATNVGRWRRSGDSIEIHWYYRHTVAGTAGSGSYLLTLPSGLSVDSGKVTAGVNGGPTYGSAMLYNGADGVIKTGHTFISGNSFGIIAGDNTNPPSVFGSSYVSFANSTIEASVEAVIPISGWNGN